VKKINSDKFIIKIMLNNYRPLFILKGFCVNENPTGIQSRRFIDALINAGIKPEIYTEKTKSNNSFTDNYDINFVSEIPHKYVKAILRRIFPDLISAPDIERFTYLNFLKEKLNSGLINNNYDWLHSISNPISCHLAGLYLKKKTNLPWIAQFYDPWVGNYYRKYKTDYFRKCDEKIEYEVAANADIIIHSNEIIKNNWIKRYGELVSDKIHVLPFCYDEKKIINNIGGDFIVKNKITVLHAGNLYLNRNLDDLISAIKILQKKIPHLEDKIIFKFVGNSSNYDKINVKKNNLEKLFFFIGHKPYNQLIEFYRSTDVLLVVDAPSKENFFFPSKLIEYLTYNKPILGITSKIGVTHDILKKSGHTAIENNKINEIADYFNTVLCDYNLLMSFDRDYYKHYSPDLIVYEYIKLIEHEFLKKMHRYK